MRALILTARFSDVPPSTRRQLTHFARKLASVPGLVSSHWMRNGSTYACHHTFESTTSADRFLTSALLRSLNDIPGCTDIYIQEYTPDPSLNAFAKRQIEAQATMPEREIAVIS